MSLFPKGQWYYILYGLFNQYVLICLVQSIVVTKLLARMDVDKLEYNLNLNERKMSYEMYSMVGNAKQNETTILNITDGGFISMLMGNNNTLFKQKSMMPYSQDLNTSQEFSTPIGGQSRIQKKSFKLDQTTLKPKKSAKDKNVPSVRRISKKQFISNRNSKSLSKHVSQGFSINDYPSSNEGSIDQKQDEMQFEDPDDEDSDQMKFIQKLFKQNKVKVIRKSADNKNEKTTKTSTE